MIVKKFKKYEIVEYTELTEQEAGSMDNKTGALMFNLGNVMMFILKAETFLSFCESKEVMNSLYT